jgi:hypothetical protein
MTRLATIALAMAVSALVLSCEATSGLLTESERSSLYTLTIKSSDGTALSNGSIVYPGTSLAAYVESKSDATSPAAMDLSLSSAAGVSVSAMRFATASAAKSATTLKNATVKTVTSLAGKLPGFSVPSSTSSGLYTLTLALSDSSGTSIQQEKLTLFVDTQQPTISSVSVFPPSVEPGASVLLSLTTSWSAVAAPSSQSSSTDSSASTSFSSSTAASSTTVASTVARDPWIRWSKDSVAFAEGLLSQGYNQAVWTAPSVEGAYAISVEVFPSAPTTTYSFKAAANQELKVMVIAASGGSGNDFADPSAFYSLLRLKGSFADTGTRTKASQSAAFGSPAIDTYSSGFGYAFDDSSGVSLPGLMPPASSDGESLGAFALLFRLDSSASSGSLARFVSADKSYSLSFGLSAGSPYVIAKVDGKTFKSVAASAIPQSPLTLEAVLTPNGDKLDIAWRAEGKYIEAPSIDLVAAPPAGDASLGGAGSLAGVYDGFGLMLPTSSNAYSPTFRLAARRAWKSALVLAESFETGLPEKAVVAGTAAADISGLSLAVDSSVALSNALTLGSGLVVSASIQGDRAASCLSFSDGAAVAFEVSGTGLVTGADGASLGSVGQTASGLQFSLSPNGGALTVAGSESSVKLPSAAKHYQITFKHKAEGSGSVRITDLLVRSSSSQ